MFLAKKNPPSLPSSFLVWKMCQVSPKKNSKSGHWRIRPNSDESLYLGNGTSDHRNEKTKTLYNRKYPPKPKKTHLRNHFWYSLVRWRVFVVSFKNILYHKLYKCPVTVQGDRQNGNLSAWTKSGARGTRYV